VIVRDEIECSSRQLDRVHGEAFRPGIVKRSFGKQEEAAADALFIPAKRDRYFMDGLAAGNPLQVAPAPRVADM
jgi:hypothetical protein